MILEWRHNGNDGVSNNQPYHCLLNRLLRRRSRKISKFRITGLCAGNSPVTGEFPAKMACSAENVSIWWRHHELYVKRWQKQCEIYKLCLGVSMLSLHSSKYDGVNEVYMNLIFISDVTFIWSHLLRHNCLIIKQLWFDTKWLRPAWVFYSNIAQGHLWMGSHESGTVMQRIEKKQRFVDINSLPLRDKLNEIFRCGAMWLSLMAGSMDLQNPLPWDVGSVTRYGMS